MNTFVEYLFLFSFIFTFSLLLAYLTSSIKYIHCLLIIGLFISIHYKIQFAEPIPIIILQMNNYSYFYPYLLDNMQENDYIPCGLITGTNIHFYSLQNLVYRFYIQMNNYSYFYPYFLDNMQENDYIPCGLITGTNIHFYSLQNLVCR